MKKSVLIAFSLVALSSFSAAQAGNDCAGGQGAAAGPYIGIALGTGGMDTPELTDTMKSFGNYSENLRGFAGRGYLGYLFGEDFKYGAELGFSLYPDNKYSAGAANWKYSGYNFDLLAILKYNFSNFNIFGKAGGAFVSQKFDFDNNSRAIFYNTTKNKLLPEIAVGLGYDFKRNFGIDITYSHIFGEKLDYNNLRTWDDWSPAVSVNMLTLGLTYHFPI